MGCQYLFSVDIWAQVMGSSIGVVAADEHHRGLSYDMHIVGSLLHGQGKRGFHIILLQAGSVPGISFLAWMSTG